jgi:hypothetical protein
MFVNEDSQPLHPASAKPFNCTAGGVRPLAEAFLQNPATAAAVLEAALRTDVVQLLPATGGPARRSEIALHIAAQKVGEAQRIQLALFGLLAGVFDSCAGDSSSCGGSSSSSGRSSGNPSGGGVGVGLGAAAQLAAAVSKSPDSHKLASLLSTLLKVANAHVYMQSEQKQQQQLSKLHGVLVNQAALVVDLSCRFGQLCNAQLGPSAATAAAAAAVSGSGSSSKGKAKAARHGGSRASSSNVASSSSSGDSPEADKHRQWMALAGKGLLLLSQRVQQERLVIVYLASLLSDSTEDAWHALHDKGGLLPLSTLLQISSRALDWLGSQLSAVGLPGLELTEPQTAAAAAAAQKAADKLLKQQAAAAEKLEVAVKAAAAFQLAAAANHMFDDVRLSDAAAKSQRLLYSQLAAAWQALESFAIDFCDAVPCSKQLWQPALHTLCPAE